MTSNKIFLDSNIILYLFDLDQDKISISQNLIAQNPIINSQILVKVGNVCKRKFGFTKSQVCELWRDLINDCVCEQINEFTMHEAIRLINKYDFQLFDAIIVAGALNAGCDILFSEDMQHNLLVENRLKIMNPFLK